MKEHFWDVAVEAPLFQNLTYKVPKGMEISRGDVLRVPLGARKAVGVAIGESLDPKSDFEIKSVVEVISELPKIPEAYVKWAEWLSKYYVFPLGPILKLLSPTLSAQVKVRKPSVTFNAVTEAPLVLNEEQSKVTKSIIEKPDFGVHVLHGITGSGKTEVYIELFKKTLEAGKRGLFLIPEIALTPQLISRFSSRFGDDIAVIHSGLTDRERAKFWWQVSKKEKRLLIGVRSALFCPIDDLGLIVIDEEHEPSYKQDEKFRYHARDAAIVLAKQLDCPVVLGSATPSLETWGNVKEGKFHYYRMGSRYGESQLPNVRVIDLAEKDAARTADQPFWLSTELKKSITEQLENKKQVVLFLNRRGEAHTVLCTDCGKTFACPNCAVNLTLHAQSHLICHYCDYHIRLPKNCTDCGSEKINDIGVGTERVEKDLQTVFPNAVIARADRDEITHRGDFEELVDRMSSQEIDILVGTQMIAKGLDFPNIELVGVLLADLTLNLPDFRASERAFQLMVQVAGRAGRSSKSGTVIVQTYNPEHPAITHSLTHNYIDFANKELEQRLELHYPPYGQSAMIRFQGNNALRVKKSSDQVANYLMSAIRNLENIQILGPVPSPIFRLRGKFRYQIFIKGPKGTLVSQLLSRLFERSELVEPGTRLSFDVDPVNML